MSTKENIQPTLIDNKNLVFPTQNMVDTKTNTQERKFGLDVLRSISVFLIVLYHFLNHGRFLVNSINANWYIQNFFYCVFLVSVNVFVLISGYFLGCSEKPFKFRKFLNLIFQASFYSTIIYILFCVIGYEQLSLYGLYQNVFVFLTNRYWFLTTYLIMYLASPFLNMIIKNISKKQFAFLLSGILFLCWCVNNFEIAERLYTHNGYSILWFVMLYLIAGGTRKFDLFNIKSWVLIIIYFFSLALLFCYAVFPCLTNSDIFNYILNPRLNYDGFWVLICSVVLLALFSRIKQPKSTKLSNFTKFLASTGFGVYLLHDNNLVRGKIYSEWFRVQNFYTDNFSSLHVLTFAFATFVVCIIIDLLRQQLDKFIKKLISFIKQKRESKKKLNLLS